VTPDGKSVATKARLVILLSGFCSIVSTTRTVQTGKRRQTKSCRVLGILLSECVSLCQQRHNGQHDFHLSTCTLDVFFFLNSKVTFYTSKIGFLGVGGLRSKSNHQEKRHNLQTLRRHQKGKIELFDINPTQLL